MRFGLALIAAAALTFPLAAQNAPNWDAKYRAIPDARNIGEYMKRMSARPHHLGSAYDKDNAEWILAKFKEWGWDAHIETYDALFPTPKERLVEMIAPAAVPLKLEEPAVAIDPTSGQKAEQLPSFNAYSIDGDVTGPSSTSTTDGRRITRTSSAVASRCEGPSCSRATATRGAASSRRSRPSMAPSAA